jgi:hypothetical protein
LEPETRPTPVRSSPSPKSNLFVVSLMQRLCFPVTYDSKHYEFATTLQPAPGTVKPPEGERWTLVEMRLAGDKAPFQAIVLWARQKKL